MIVHDYLELSSMVKGVLRRIVEDRGCPCTSERFRYWVGKEQGPGWQDNIQNLLVEAAVELPLFRQIPCEVPEYGLENLIQCDNCSMKWKYFSIEWRMLAFHKRLVPARLEPLPFCGIRGDSIFATAGKEPASHGTVLTAGEWAEFMLFDIPHPGKAEE